AGDPDRRRVGHALQHGVAHDHPRQKRADGEHDSGHERHEVRAHSGPKYCADAHPGESSTRIDGLRLGVECAKGGSAMKSIRSIVGNRETVTVASMTSVLDAARLMSERHIGALPVVDGERLAG